MVDLFCEYMTNIPWSGPSTGSNPPKFSNQVIGFNMLSAYHFETFFYQWFCEEAGFTGILTKNSSKTTCAISLFQSVVDEQLIVVQSGHCTDAIRAGCGAFQHLQPPAQTKPLPVKNEAVCMGSKPPIT